MHISRIEHRDIKPANIFISRTNPDNNEIPELKIADFEFCGMLVVNENGEIPYSLPVGTGTDGYMAAELYDVNQLQYQESIPFAIDIFAAGCVFCVTFSGGTHPFGPTNMRTYYIKMGKLDFNSFNWTCDQLFYQLMKSMLNRAPSARPTATEVLQNPYFNELLEFCKTTEDWQSNDTFQRFAALVENPSTDVNVRDADGQTPLMLLCLRNQTISLVDYIKKLLEREDVDVNSFDTVDGNGFNALLLLCIQYKHDNLLEIIQLLIANGINVMQTNTNGVTALIWLCQYSKSENIVEVIKVLIANGVNVHHRDNYGKNAAYYLKLRNDIPNEKKKKIVQKLQPSFLRKMFHRLTLFHT
jgi:ankyrin repeat protein